MSIISNAINFSPLGDSRLMPLKGWKQPSQSYYPVPGTLLEALNNCHLNFDFHNLLEQVMKNSKFELWRWRRLLRVPWTARRSNQSILKEISPGCSLEGLMLKLKLQYFGHLMRRVDSLEKSLMLGRIGGRGRRGRQRIRWLHGITDSMDMSLSKLQKSEGQGSLVSCCPWVSKSWTQVNNWTTTTATFNNLSKVTEWVTEPD